MLLVVGWVNAVIEIISLMRAKVDQLRIGRSWLSTVARIFGVASANIL
jgi:hypothetical protein